MSDLRMPSINTVSLTGRLVQDPDFKITENGTARLSARVAINRPYRDRDGQWQTESSFLNIVVWREFAESLADRLHKGSPVFVSGRLRSSSWKDSDDNPHSAVEIQVRTLQVLERAENAGVPVSEDISEEIEAEGTEEEEEMELETA